LGLVGTRGGSGGLVGRSDFKWGSGAVGQTGVEGEGAG
jgi:hypothetical protein